MTTKVQLRPVRFREGDERPDGECLYYGNEDAPDKSVKCQCPGGTIEPGDWYVPVEVLPPLPDPVQVRGCQEPLLKEISGGSWRCSSAWGSGALFGGDRIYVTARTREEVVAVHNAAAEKISGEAE